MKIVISFIVVMMYSFLHAQCDNRVSTNPSTANNFALPDIDGQVNSPDTRYLNGFNWWADGFYQLTGMQYNPTQPYVDISNIQDPFQSAYYHYLVEALGAEEMNPQNGWELLLVNVGRFSDDATPIPLATADLHSFPYIVIYNKFLGKIRVFCKFGLDQTVYEATDAVEISFRFANEDQYSGAMRLYAGTDRSLDLQTEVTVMTSVTKAQNFGNKWYSTDFQIAYDPCTCFYPSKIQ